MEEERTLSLFPRRLARKLAKAEIGSNELSHFPWQLAAASRVGKFKKQQKEARNEKRNQ